MLTPKKEITEVRDIRQQWEYNLEHYYKAKARGDKSEMNERREKIMAIRKKVAEYSASKLNKLLPILIDDIDTKLKLPSVIRNSGGKHRGTTSGSSRKCGNLRHVFCDGEGVPASFRAP